MAIGEGLLPEFDQEMANTRKILERVPEDKFAWKPHPKSGAMGWLAAHVAGIPQWASMTMDRESLDLAPQGQRPQPPAPPASRTQLLDGFDKNASAARQAISTASDSQFLQPWTLLNNGKILLTLPRIAVLRSFVMNHLIHHRAQLTVYLRMNDVAIPGLYGPSADENPMGF